MDSRLLALSDAFASAAVDPSGWLVALRMLADATGSSHGQLMGVGGNRAIAFNWVDDFPDKALEQFRDMDGADPRINPRMANAMDAPLLAVRSEKDYRRVIPTLQSDICLDFFRDYDISNGCQATVYLGNGDLVGLAVLRSDSDGETTAEQRAIFAAAAPFVRSAVRTQMALERDGPKLVIGALDSVSAAVFICDRHGHIVSHTAAADALLSDGRITMAGGLLRAGGREDQERLARAFALHAGPVPVPMASIVLKGGPDAGAPLLLDVVTMPHGPWSLDFEPRILVIVHGADRWRSTSSAILRNVYGLSPGEADVAIRLARGQPRDTIAEERGAGRETIRSQIKSIFAKLGISREVELVAMLGQLLRT